MQQPPLLILTMGDPNGLGPELICDLLSRSHLPLKLLILGPPQALEHHALSRGIAPLWNILDHLPELGTLKAGAHVYCPHEVSDFQLRPGYPTVEGGRTAGLCLELALKILKDPAEKGLVTGPLNKAMLQEAGFDFSGHTEFLAHGSNLSADDVCMHLCGSRLRVSLVTTHPPLRRVPGLIEATKIIHCLKLTCDFLETQDLLSRPVAVCGLNPHAGEGGAIGREEIEIIAPAVEEAVKSGLDVVGPLPADTVFHQAYHGHFSAVLAMYHDQGLGPLKLVHFDEAVNVTLGLPFIRTSVGHGTGYDIVGTGRGSSSSLEAAVDMAWRMAVKNQEQEA